MTEASHCAPGQFHASYYNNTSLSGTPALTRCESDVNYNRGTKSPAPGVNADGFSVKWEGDHDFQDGDYTFSVTADEGPGGDDLHRDQNPEGTKAPRTGAQAANPGRL